MWHKAVKKAAAAAGRSIQSYVIYSCWSYMSMEEQMETVCSIVEEVLEAVKVGEMCLLHPSSNYWSNIQIHQLMV